MIQQIQNCFARAGDTLLAGLAGSKRAKARPAPRRGIDCCELEDRTLLSVTPLGGETLVNTTTSDTQTTSPSPQAVAADANGNFVVTWTSFGQGGDDLTESNVYAQRFDVNGNALGTEFLVNTSTGGTEGSSAIAMDDDGNFVIVWEADGGRDGDGQGIFGQLFDSSGNKVGSDFQVNSYSNLDQTLPSVAMDADGDFVVTWTSDGQDGSGLGVYAQRFDETGAKQGAELQVHTTTSNDQRNSVVAMDDAGNFVITWSLDGGDSWGIRARVFNAAGTALTGELQVNTTTDGHQYLSSVAMDADGDFVIAWGSSNQDGDGQGVYAQRFNAAGALQGTEFLVNNTTTGDQDLPTVAMDSDGNFVVAWTSHIQDGAARGVYAREYLANGTANGNEFLVNTTTAGEQYAQSVVMASSRIVVTWSGSGSGDSSGVFLQRYLDDINNAPVNIVPTTQTAGENTPLVFSVANGNRIAVSDSDVGASDLMEITLQVTSGTLTLNGSTGLTFSAGGPTNSSLMIFQGTMTNINNALNGMSYNTGDNPAASAVLSILTNDLGHTGVGGSKTDTDDLTININRVNDAPVNTVPGSQTTSENTPLVFSSAGGNQISIADVDAGSNPMQVTLWGTNGLLSLNGTTGLTFSVGDGTSDATMTFTGTISNINTALNGMSFTPDLAYSGPANVNITTSDQGSTGSGGALSDADSISITVTSPNDAPVNTVPGAQSTSEDTPLVFSSAGSNQISIADSDAGTNPVQVTLAVTNGGLTLAGTTGLTFSSGDGTADTSMTFTGTISNINTALNGLFYTPTGNYSGGAVLTITTNDQGNSGTGGAQSDSDTVNITVSAVNDAPVNTVPGAQSTNEDTTLVFSSAGGNQISISDTDASTNPVQVTLSVTNGSLTLAGTTGLTFSSGDGTADASMTFTGTIANINTALNGLFYTPTGNYAGGAVLTITTNDQGNVGSGGAQSDVDTVNITVNAVNDAPVNTVPGAQSTSEDTTLVFSSVGGNQISISDIDASTNPVQVTLGVTNGSLTLAGTTGLTFSSGDGTADASMTFTGTISNINTALNGLFYTPTGNYNGGATLTITTNDQGNVGSGGAQSDVDTVNITVNSVNDAPVNTEPGAQSTSEDTALVFSSGNGNQISIADPDASTNPVQVTLSVTNGSLTLAGTTGLTFSSGDGTADASMSFTGTISNINTALNGLFYTPTGNYSGGATLTLTTNDQGNVGSGGAQSDVDTVNITVNAANDAPVNTVPGAQSTTEDTTLVFSSAGGNQISISDTDASTNPVQVTLSVTNGSLTLAGTTGLTFSSGDGTADASMTFTGTISNINTAINGLSYTPTGNYAGGAVLTITTNDQGNVGSGGAQSDIDTVNITVSAVNDGPVNTVPGAQSTNEDTTLVFSSAGGNQISISDVDAATNPVQVTLSVTNGSLTLAGTTGLTFSSGDGTADASMTFTGTLSNINTALNGLAYTPTGNYNGGATLTITTNDQGNVGTGGAQTDGDTVNITVNAVNDAPVNAVPGAQSTSEDTTLVFSSAGGNQISISDIDASTNPVQVTLSVTNGSLTLAGTAGLTFSSGDGTADTSMTFTGTISNINTALNGLSYTPTGNYTGGAVLTITTNDQGNSGSGGAQTDVDTVNITVSAANDAPANTVPGAQSTSEDTALVFSSGNGNQISISDVDASTNPVQVTLSVTNGSLTLAGTTGLTFSSGDGTADASMTFTGTIANINTALNGLFYTPTGNYAGGAVLTITTNDQGNVGSGGARSDVDTVNITVGAVNDAPVNTVPGAQSTNEDTALVFSSAGGNQISITDVDASTNPVQLTLSITNGSLTLAGTAGLTFSSGDGTADTSMTFTGTIANINTALNGLAYTPTGNYNGPATLTITTNDQGNSGSGGAQTDVDTVNVTVNAVNDAPLNTVPGAQSTNEETSLVFSSAGGNQISISDIDAGTNPVQVTLSVTNGSLTLAGTTGLTFSSGDGTADASMTFTGTISNINTALDGLSYTPTGNYSGPATLTITTNDQGNVGSGGAQSDVDTVNITVSDVNDAPVNTVPGAQSTSEDATLVFSSGNGNQISIADVDASTNPVQVTLSITNGSLTLAGTTGLTFSSGDGTADASMTFTGTMSNINTALNGLFYTPTGNYNGPATLTITTNDQGNVGSGGTQTDVDTVNITVNAVNDAPVNTVPGAQATSEETSLVFSSAGGNQISISDVDASTNPVQVTLSVTNGSLTLAGTSGLTFSSGDGTADTTMTFAGTINNINTALDGLFYTPTGNYAGGAVLTVTTNDQGNVGSGGAQSDVDTVNITVSAVNDAPINTVPPAQSTSEDTALVFSSGNGNQISISDVDAATNPVQVTISVTNGSLTLAGTTGLTFSSGVGTADPTMTFTGTISNINAALNGLSYSPTGDYNGPATLTITTNDQGNVGSGGTQSDVDTVNITVDAINDAPVNTVPAAQSTNEDTPVVFSSANGNAITIADPDSGVSPLLINLSVTSGSLTLSGTSGLSFTSGDGTADSSMVFTGSLADVNAALDGLRFAPVGDWSGTATVSITVDDQGATGFGGPLTDSGSVDIVVAAVNDVPLISLPGAQEAGVDGLTFSAASGNAISVSDVDAGANPVQMSIVATEGTLTLGSTAGLTLVSGTGVDDASMVFTGRINDVNAALEGARFDPSGDNASLAVTVDDQGNTGAGGSQTAQGTVAVAQFIAPPPPSDAPPSPGPGPDGEPSVDDGSDTSNDGNTPPIVPAPSTPAMAELRKSDAAMDDAGQAPIAMKKTQLMAFGLENAIAQETVDSDKGWMQYALWQSGKLLGGAHGGVSVETDPLWNQVDLMANQLTSEDRQELFAIGVAGGITVLFSAAYVMWCLRGGALVATALSSFPMWRSFDPLPVLEFWEKNSSEKEDEEESLEELVM